MVKEAITAALAASQHVVLTARTLADLGCECGNVEEAVKWLHGEVNRIGRPVGINMKDGDNSQTIFLSPTGWTTEKLRGYIATSRAVELTIQEHTRAMVAILTSRAEGLWEY